jgi:hypothetical protein
MAESPAETARVPMQSDRARGVSLHRPCPALCLPGYRGYPVPLVPPLAGLAPAIHAFPAVVGAAFKNVGGRNKSGQGDLGFYRARYEQPISLNRTATGQASGLM